MRANNRILRTGDRRGFTLVELLVAITAGALVAAAAVLLSKNAVRLFQEEARISYAQVAVSMGLGRMGTDLEHAGRNTTRNPFTDRRICAQTNLVDWPAGMRRLAPVVIETRPDLPQNAGNDLRNERITIAGDLDSGENFVMSTTLPGASTTTIVLQPQSRAIRRLTALTQNGNVAARLAELFRVGRILHIEGPTSDYYGRIQGFAATGTPIDSVQVTIENTPVVPIQSSAGTGPSCAIKGFGSGWPVHVISRVRYELRSVVSDASFADYVQPLNPVTGDVDRTELVRVELAPDDSEIPGTLELVTEYAIALRFGISALTVTSQPDAPVLERFPITDPVPNPQVYAIAGPPDVQGSRPEAVRSVQVRLSTRSRAPDRPTQITAPAGRPFRFLVGSAKGADRFARVRTLEREFALVNTRGGGS
ncbi:prepilin-type N-terminal cleavage/methylation domain-containing protein [Polyangium sp. 6x1]|uniref:prepilin-type N-terminal cleavage/methylation domain-containing protein n=1 Tax=Polyangium sp. 6x1 TaxID=3042689 RepID=UPI00248314E2|nr:prepilin-type N-terminal cleavage/methylation domain-containing protein [Polyangium sp. 6x1]MDI1445474.1 prepilin-type N-terminal cleavage/methylation domain-containing protein [Polyangium sp. 6x1]